MAANVSQLRTQKDLKDQDTEPEDAVDLTGLTAEEVARALQETGLGKKGKSRDPSPVSGADDDPPQECDRQSQPELSDPTDGVPQASLQAAGKIVTDQVTKKGPPCELKSVPGTADMAIKPAPMAPLGDICEGLPGPLPPPEPTERS